MEEIIAQEKMEENRSIYVLKSRQEPSPENQWIRGVTTRRGTQTGDPDENLQAQNPKISQNPQNAGRNTQDEAQENLNLSKNGKHVTFKDEEDEIVELTPIAPENSPEENFSGPENLENQKGLTLSDVPDQAEKISVWGMEWNPEYQKCPKWGEIWKRVINPENGSSKGQESTNWPEDIKFLGEKLFFQEKLCIPLSMQEILIKEYHVFLCHIGCARLWENLENKYAWADLGKAKKFTMTVLNKCPTCQACVRAKTMRAPINFTIIPNTIMTSVALDLFHMPTVMFEGEKFDMMAVCIDRHSGWIIAVTCQNRGLTGAKVAKAMLQQWRPFGIPSVITTDQGSHYVAAWWETMCARLGIRHAVSQAYHHQANGRAERAGQQLLEILRKLKAHDKLNWVEALPQTIDRIHDNIGETGESPYRVIFGR